jgi:Uma2 family endonuclease
MDSGIRSGTDVIRAVALGAQATFASKAFLWGLGALGIAGPAHVIDLLIAETKAALGQIGALSLAEARSVDIRHPEAWGTSRAGERVVMAFCWIDDLITFAGSAGLGGLMNIQTTPRMSKAAFFAWAEGFEERCELVEGAVMMMTRISRDHGIIAGNLFTALRSRLDPKAWQVIAEFGLDAGPDTVRYPDIVVDRIGGGRKDYTATAPVLLAEILSPSTAVIDLGDKAAEYLQLASLRAYLVLSQDEPKAWAWLREEGAFASGPALFHGNDAVIPIAALRLELPLAEIYAGIAN